MQQVHRYAVKLELHFKLSRRGRMVSHPAARPCAPAIDVANTFREHTIIASRKWGWMSTRAPAR